MKKYIIFAVSALLALLLAFSFASCSLSFVVVGGGNIRDPGKVTEKADESGEGTESKASDEKNRRNDSSLYAEEAEKRLAELPDYDCEGQNFIIATASKMTFATDGEDYYDRALLYRDSMVEKRYNVDIVTVFTPENEMAAALKNARLSGDYFADAVSVPEYRVGTLVSDGSLMSLRTLPFWDSGSSYTDYATEAAAGNAIYADLGAASADFSRIYAVFYNKDIEKSLGVNLAGIAKKGEWTWDEYERYALLATDTLGIAGQGSVYMGDEYTDAVLVSGGLTLIDNAAGRVPKIKFDSEKVENAVDTVCALVYGNPSAYRPKNGTPDEFFDEFGGGRLFMGIAPLYRMADFSVRNADFGVLPIPKTSAEQTRYYGYTEAAASVLCVPSDNNKIEMTGYIINALNTASYKYLAEEYKKSSLYNYFRSEEPLEAFDLVTGSITYDFAYLYSSCASLLKDASIGAVREARKSATSTATKLISERATAANAELERIFGAKKTEDETDVKPTTGEAEETKPETPAETTEPAETTGQAEQTEQTEQTTEAVTEKNEVTETKPETETETAERERKETDENG